MHHHYSTLKFEPGFTVDYFKKLMIQQLKEGTLDTTAQLPDWVLPEGKNTI